MKLHSLLGMTVSLLVLGELQPKVALGDHKSLNAPLCSSFSSCHCVLNSFPSGFFRWYFLKTEKSSHWHWLEYWGRNGEEDGKLMVNSLLLILKENLCIICLSMQDGVNSVKKWGLNSCFKNPSGITSVQTQSFLLLYLISAKLNPFSPLVLQLHVYCWDLGKHFIFTEGLWQLTMPASLGSPFRSFMLTCISAGIELWQQGIGCCCCKHLWELLNF